MDDRGTCTVSLVPVNLELKLDFSRRPRHIIICLLFSHTRCTVATMKNVYRRKMFSRLLRFGIECFAVLLSGIGGGTRLVLGFLLNLDKIGSDCL